MTIGRYKSRTGSTRTASPGWIVSDHEKNIKLNEIETFNHLKVKIPVKSGPKLSFWWTDANSVRKIAYILPSSGSMIVKMDAAGSGMDEH